MYMTLLAVTTFKGNGVVGNIAGILETLSPPAIDATIEDTEAEVGMTKSVALILLVLFKAILTSGLGAVSLED